MPSAPSLCLLSSTQAEASSMHRLWCAAVLLPRRPQRGAIPTGHPSEYTNHTQKKHHPLRSPHSRSTTFFLQKREMMSLKKDQTPSMQHYNISHVITLRLLRCTCLLGVEVSSPKTTQSVWICVLFVSGLNLNLNFLSNIHFFKIPRRS